MRKNAFYKIGLDYQDGSCSGGMNMKRNCIRALKIKGVEVVSEIPLK